MCLSAFEHLTKKALTNLIIKALRCYLCRGNQNVIELLNLRSTIYFEDLLKFVRFASIPLTKNPMQKTYLFILLASLCFLSFETQATVIFVHYSSSGTNTGASWTNAFTTLQPALNAASAGDSIFIAEGTYKPTLDPSSGTASGNTRDYAFYLDKDIKIYGGFAGTETALSQRNSGSNPVILSGDIGGNSGYNTQR